MKIRFNTHQSKWLQRSVGFLALVITLGTTILAHAQIALKKTLPNGLTVLVQENHAAPVVAVRVYVKTGSIYEGPYLGTGISHLFEHTLFEGTKNRTKEQLNEAIQSIGGQSNAYTSKDVTAYHITTASSYFDRALDVLADMMQNSTFPEAEVKTQIGVIHNEMNLGDDDPDSEIYDVFNETAFKVHPVRHPIIGYRENFDRITQSDIVSYYNTH
ncbi:MAG: zinc protease, partial [Abditibacteriota bacterium]|nr:zinc protease [Abditibacteriota bacterium]